MPIEDPCVIRLLAEGAVIELFGRQEPDGTWSFIGSRGSVDIEDDGNDSVRVAGVRRCMDLAAALPESCWIRFRPMYVHPELREWFRTRYDAAVAALPAYERKRHHEHRHRHWQALFDSTPPDGWSSEATLETP